ncbi:MAG: UvrB/UvrC motif-containing protein [bacterium]
MKCEICHQAEAETAIRKGVAGEAQELYVCPACARKEAGHQATLGPQPPVHRGESDGMPALPLMGMILDAALEIVGRAMSLPEPSCPVCGILRDEYRKRSRLGCPACYAAFAKELDAAVFELHRASQHVGKTPEKAQAVWQRQQLENALNDAVKGQRYEEAIALRDQLKKIEEPNGKQGGRAGC